ncbi:MAG: 1-deoxy-D-xylulose-5-phosphate reductoisomerase [Defluviicoccus sp.]|nr:1-deoxy-D-xylulose-5-phosphate reductoisomerase [Defluviicoccus sp.]
MVAAGAPRTVTVLGSTGSVGCSTIDLIEREPERFEVAAVTANTNAGLLADQARRVGAGFAAIADPAQYRALSDALGDSGIECAAGAGAIVEAAERPAEWVMAGIVGAAGLAPTLAAVRRGAIVALANKECLVCAGSLFIREVAASGATLLPVDSEHNAIYQVFASRAPETVERIILTASGGPFRTASMERIASATPEQAVAHPNWDMGAKISVDSATMMNKGLELIEAHHLFGLPGERIEIVIHPQSIVHSMVAYIDGSVLAQLGTPDMRIPISYALAWPHRMNTPSERLDLCAIARLDFEEPDPVRFPALRLAREALGAGGAAPTVLNAANEEAVGQFLAGRIGFLEIARIVETVLEEMAGVGISTLDDVREADRAARVHARAAQTAPAGG